MSNTQILYTDGSCIPNPGKGGWGFVAFEGDIEWHVSGGENHTTNNKMELTAVIKALEFCAKDRKDIKYIINTDSMYVINCAKGVWARKKNTILWEEFDKISKGKNIEWVWVKGHSGNKYNEIVDKLCKKESMDL